MTTGLKAIETTYKGYRFRSRLEARWAVYFDSLGVEWEYEPQGFDLPTVGKYLPDFWLTTVNMWAEVKAKDLTDEENAKCIALADASGYPVLMLTGTPSWKAYYAWQMCDWDDAGCFGPGKHFRHVIWLDYHLTSDYLHENRFFCCGLIGNTPDDDIAEKAIVAARSARFEFGESGPPK